MVWAGALARHDEVAVIGVAAVSALLFLVLTDAVGALLGQSIPHSVGLECIEDGVWLEYVGLLLYLSPGLLLLVSSVSTTPAAAPITVILSASKMLLQLELYRLLELYWMLVLHQVCHLYWVELLLHLRNCLLLVLNGVCH